MLRYFLIYDQSVAEIAFGASSGNSAVIARPFADGIPDASTVNIFIRTN
jgi:hypothetical protein